MKMHHLKTSFSPHFILLGLIFSFASLSSFAQVVFEPGYFIDNEDTKTECRIKNYEWKNSPTQIEYQLSDSNKTRKKTILDVKEFRVANQKYQRYTVEIDKSAVVIENLSAVKDPLFEKDTLLLKVLIEGEASLYAGGKPWRYFYNVNNSEVKQLIHKEYLASESEIATNNYYKSQLWNDLKCSCLNTDDFRHIDFTKRALIKTFEKYNECINSAFVNFDKNRTKGKINLRIKPGYRYSTLTVSNSYNMSQNIDFGGDNTFSIGLEVGYVFPFNKNKWAIIFEPTYQYYYSEDPRPHFNNTVDYHSIEFPIGIKYNMFLNDKSRIFLIAAFVIWDAPINSSMGALEIKTMNNLIMGAGYCYNNKYSVEFRYGTKRELLTNYVYYSSNYQSFSFVLGYNIF